MGWFKHWFGTRYYSLLYGHRDDSDAQGWVVSIVQRWELVPGNQVLDLACGRGRHASGFAAAGMNVAGLDISEESIAQARKAVPNAEFHVHDMREPFAMSRFDAVCCLFTSLGYFDDLNDDRAVFRAVFDALKPGGRFVIDFMNTALVLRDLVPHEQLTVDDVHFEISRSYENGVLVKRIRTNEHGRQEDFEERVQALMPEQLEEMAVGSGFVIEDRTDGPVLSPFDKSSSQRYVLWLIKPATWP